MNAKAMAASLAIFVLAGCQPQTAAVPPGECVAPRIAAAFERSPPALRPADLPPRPSVLPTRDVAVLTKGQNTGTALPNTGTTATLYGIVGDQTAQTVLAYGQNGTVLRGRFPFSSFVPQNSGTNTTLYRGTLVGSTIFWINGVAGYLGFVDLNQ